MLEACDGAGMRRKRRLTLPILRIPNPQSAVSGGGDETVVREVEKTNERGVTLQIIQARTGLQIPDFDEVVHGA